MDNFTFYSPTRFVFGKGTENESGAYVKQFGGSKVLVHYGSGSVVRKNLWRRKALPMWSLAACSRIREIL